MTACTPIIALLASMTLLAGSAIAGPDRNSRGRDTHRLTRTDMRDRGYSHSDSRNSGHNKSRHHNSGYSGSGHYGSNSSKHSYGNRSHYGYGSGYGYSGSGHYRSGHYGSRHNSSYGYSSPSYGFSVRYTPSYGYRSTYRYNSPSYGHTNYGHTRYDSNRHYGSSTTVYRAPARTVIVKPSYKAAHDAGWDALMYGNASRALDYFSNEASAYPRKALPKVLTEEHFVVNIFSRHFGRDTWSAIGLRDYKVVDPHDTGRY